MTPTLPPLALNAWLRWDVIDGRLAHIAPPKNILEIGMGQGAVGARLARRATYTGVEPDASSQAIARSRLPADSRVVDDLADLAQNERFDLVAAFEVLEHIDDDLAALVQWRGFIEPGGHLVMSMPAHAHRFGPWDTRVGHFRRYDRTGLIGLITEAGLEPVEVAAVGYPLGNVLEHGRNTIARLERRRQGSMSVAERTAASGRAWQPPDAIGSLTDVLSRPFRAWQRSAVTTDRGTGWVVLAQLPER